MISPLHPGLHNSTLPSTRQGSSKTLNSFGAELSSRLATKTGTTPVSGSPTKGTGGVQRQIPDARPGLRQNLVTQKSAPTSTATTTAANNTGSTLPTGPTPGWIPAMGSIITLPWLQAAEAPAAASTKAAATTQSPGSGAVSGTQTAVTSADPVSMLSNALKALGIDPSQVQMSAHNDTVYYPGDGSSWVNHNLTVTANGHTETFDVNLMKLNPNVAAVEAQEDLGL